MSGEACRLPSSANAAESRIICRLLAARRIVVVGASDDPTRAGNYVPQYLIEIGKEVIPVTPNHEQVLGRKCYRSLAEVPGPIDLVNVFRRPLACPDIVRQAISARAKGVWLQSGIISDEAKELAEQAGIDFVQDRCIMADHRRSVIVQA